MNPNNYNTRSKKGDQTIIEQQSGTPARQIQPFETRIIHFPVPSLRKLIAQNTITSPHSPNNKRKTIPTTSTTRKIPAPTSRNTRTSGRGNIQEPVNDAEAQPLGFLSVMNQQIQLESFKGQGDDPSQVVDVFCKVDCILKYGQAQGSHGFALPSQGHCLKLV